MTPSIRRSFAALALATALLAPPATAEDAARDAMEFARERYLLDGGTPAVCLDFSAPVAFPPGAFAEDYVAIEPRAAIDVRVQDGALCLGGLRWGTGYAVTVRPGVPAGDGRASAAPVEIALAVPDAPPSVGFAGGGYVLAQEGETMLPLTTVNLDRVRLRVLRIVDRNLMEELAYYDLTRSLAGWSVERIAEVDGELVWEGTVDTAGPRNERVRTGVPIDQVIDRATPGVHVAVAEPADAPAEPWISLATRWLVVSNLGLTSFTGEDGLSVFVNSLDAAAPLAGVETVLIARNNKVLGRVVTDAEGRADFAAGLLRGGGGNEPTALMAYGPGDDFTVMRLTGPAFDLADRGVSGRDAPGPLDGFLWADRDIYRPGETVHLAGLLRTAEARAADGLPLTLVVLRPDGQDFRRLVLPPHAGGAYETALALPRSAPMGAWNALLYADPAADPIARLGFVVEDFVPERLDLTLSAEAATIAPETAATVALEGRFLFGAPAAVMRATAELVVVADPEPFPDWQGYRFGLATEGWTALRGELPETRTDADGKGAFAVTLPEIGDTTLPLLARVRATLLEPGGRGVTRALDLKIRRAPLAIGIRPGFAEDTVAESSTPEFQVVALDAEGVPLDVHRLDWELVREVWNYDWVRRDGNWEVETSVHNRRVDSATLTTTAGRPATLAVPVDWGWYRLEVYDRDTGAASSVRFQAGWRAGPSAGTAPDKVKVTLDRTAYRPGDPVRVFVEPPYAGEALVTVLGRGILETRRISVPEGGAEFTLTADDDWGAAGAYLAVTLLRPGRPTGGSDAPPAPDRAIGLAWVGLDRGERTLGVSILSPAETLPQQRLIVPVAVSNLGVGEQAWLTLAAVDRGVLALTGFETPDPAAHFYGKRRLAIDLRDLYGRLIDGAHDRVGTLRAGGDAMGRHNTGPDTDAYETVALFSGIVAVGPGGRVEIPLDIPDFNGELRLMAVAFSADKVGRAEAPLPVRPPVVAELSRPRFLAPGDVAELTLELHNLTGGAGDYQVAVAAGGAAEIGEGGTHTVALATGGKAERSVQLKAIRAGTTEVTLTVDGPGGVAVERRFALSVRPAQSVHTESRTVWLTPGSALRLDPALTAGFTTDSARLAVTLGTVPSFGLPTLIAALNRYPYGCLEQTVSTAMPLLYRDELAAYADLDADGPALRERLQQAIWRMLDMQRSDGAFSLWDAYGAPEAWLSAYTLDFLTRARAAGYTVPDNAYRLGLDWLATSVVDEAEWTPRSVARPYALYVLAKAGRSGVAGAARYLADHRADDLPAGARGHLAATLTLLGETGRAGALLDIADTAADATERDWSPEDYGTRLRDAALRLTVLAESMAEPRTVAALADRVANLAAGKRWLSTQEMGWLVLAGKAMLERQSAIVAEIDGRLVGPQSRPIAAFPGVDAVARGYTVANRGGSALRVSIAATGIPAEPLVPDAVGFTVDRRIHALDGSELAAGEPFVQGRRYVVVLTGRTDHAGAHQGLVVDLLPAGLEIENARLRGGGDVGDFAWLPALTEARHLEMRDDRFVAAYDLSADNAEIAAAYVVRAVTRGEFARPAPYVEDMYQPHRFARGAMDRIAVVGDR